MCYFIEIIIREKIEFLEKYIIFLSSSKYFNKHTFCSNYLIKFMCACLTICLVTIIVNNSIFYIKILNCIHMYFYCIIIIIITSLSLKFIIVS